MEQADEMRELREVGGQSAIDREHIRQTKLNVDFIINQIAKGYRAKDTQNRQLGGDNAQDR